MAVNLSFIGGAGWQFLTDNGKPLDGGKIYTYAAGTTTPLATYTDRTGTTPNANPIVLDSAGRTPNQIWSTEGLLYKYVVKTSGEVQIRSWDNIGGSVVASDLGQDLAAADGGTMVGFLQAGTGAVLTNAHVKLRENVSVLDFGADPTGAASSVAAITTAAAAFDTLTLPVGTYLINSNLTISSDIIGTGGMFSINSGIVLTITGAVLAGRVQIFTGLGSVKFTDATDWADDTQIGGTNTVFPEWWGTGASALQTACYSIAALTSASTDPSYLGGTVSLANTYYNITDTLIIPDHVCVRGISPEQRQACIKATGAWTASHPVVQVGKILGTQYWSHGSQLHDCTVDANHLANVGVYSNMANENSGVSGLIVRKWLLYGIWYEDTYSISTSPRTMHTTISKCDVFSDTAITPAAYPDPSLCVGIKVSSSGSAKNSAVSQFASFVIDRCTFTNVAGQSTYYAANQKYSNIGAAFAFDGVSNVSLYDSHGEHSDIGVRIGKDNRCYGVKVCSYDGYNEDKETVQINTNSDNISLRNIYAYFYNTGAYTNITAADNTITTKSHGRDNGDLVYVISDTDATVIAEGLYYVVQATTNTFKISLTSGGAEIDLTGGGVINFATKTVNDQRNLGAGQSVFDMYVTEYSTGRVIHGAKNTTTVGSDTILWVSRGKPYNASSPYETQEKYRPSGRVAVFEHSTTANVDIVGGTVAKLNLANSQSGSNSSIESDTNGYCTITAGRTILAAGLSTYADNTAALAAGLAVGTLYRTAIGAVMITY